MTYEERMAEIAANEREVLEDGKRRQPIFTMVWATARAFRERVADVPEHWLYTFAANHRESIRKFASARNGKLLFRVADVLDAIERREGMPV